ncbi:hypothetical protein ACUNWD_01970 [Sunxiuqinia sp. A32]|uniref:hypothetical protein n=1 Tax=Sunxiuqinia sp. A32 TaxID=3461496 RepID=UPI00404624BF
MFSKTKILTWLVVILLATNISTVISVMYFSKKDTQEIAPLKPTEIPGEKRARFFKEHLGLQEQQMDIIRDANRNFNRQSRWILLNLESLREDLVNEMTKDNSDTLVLNRISEQIGEEHTKLKKITYSFYNELSSACNEQEKEKLSELFQSLISSEKNIQLPQRRQGRFNRD